MVVEKTTLVNMILNEEGIDISKNVRIGYFSQSMDILDENKTILENVMEKKAFIMKVLQGLF